MSGEMWFLYDDVPTGHHPGYLEAVAAAAAEVAVRPIVAAPTRPPSVPHEDWIEVAPTAHRQVIANRRKYRSAEAVAFEMGARTLVDLYLDRNVWSISAQSPMERRLHVLHHAEQYNLGARKGLARMRGLYLHRRVRHLTSTGGTVVVHTPRALEIVSATISGGRIALAGYPVRTFPPRPVAPALEPPVAIFVGSGREQKGLDRLVSAVSLLPPGSMELRVVGKQPADLASALTPRARPNEVTWLDRFVTDEELEAEYRGASFAVLPYRDSFGENGGASSVLLETIAHGLPIVTTPALATQLPAGEGGAVVAASDSPDALAVALRTALATLPELDDRARATGPDHIRRNHTYPGYVASLAHIARD